MRHSKAVDLMDPMEALAGAVAVAVSGVQALGTSETGTYSFDNADGTSTVIGAATGDVTLATHVGDTTPPPVPTGIAATSVDGTVAVTWDGTLEGDVPADFYRVNLYVDGVWFAALSEAGSCLTPPQEVGSTVSVTATSEDDACLWDGTPAHNVSEPCAPVEVVVRDLFAEGAAELDAAREEAREAIDAVDRTAAEAAQAVAGAVAAAGEAKDAADAASSAADELRRTAATKTEVTQAVDAAKGEVLTSVAADYVDKETGATLATRSELAQTASSIRSEVSEAYATKESTEGLASRSELEQTATSIRAEVARDYVDKATGAAYATKSELKVESDAIRAEVGDDRVILGLSGGVDSSVVAALCARAIGKQLTCVFVNHGLLRKGEPEEVEEVFTKQFDVDFIHVHAEERYLELLAGVTDPEEKRRIIGTQFWKEFFAVAEDLAQDGRPVKYLAQGTIYPDIIESGARKTGGKASTIKSHHNLIPFPEGVHFDLIEPLDHFFKDEVRELGTTLGLPDEVVYRQPFPGPGLAIRIIGDVTPEKLEMLKGADRIVREELDAYNARLFEETGERNSAHSCWQYFAVLPDIKSVGVMGDERTYARPIILRAVESQDAMTADWARLPYELIARVSSRVVAEVPGVNRVVYDVTSKPPATVEWE